MAESKVDREATAGKLKALQGLGVPYTDEEIAQAPAALEGKTEMDAVIAYLQGMGTAIKTRR